ncbi:methyl-accepting chemotaxis protein [Gammaproteobacteria bacterium]
MINIHTISIRQLMTSLVALISIFMLGLMIMVWQKSHEINDDLRSLTEFGQTASMVKDIRYHTVQVQQFLTDAALTHESDGITEARNHARAAQTLFDQLGTIEPTEQTHLQAAANDLKAMLQIGEEMVDAYLKNGMEAGNILMKRPNTGFDDRSLQVQRGVERLVQNLEGKLKQQGNDVFSGGQALVTRSAEIQILVSTVILMGSLLALFLIRNQVKKLIESLDEAFSALSRGDLTFHMDATANGEIGQISRIFNNFIKRFEETVRDFLRINDQISSATAENYINAHDTANGVEKQSQQIHEMAAAATQINSTITYLANNAIAASEAAREVADLVQCGNTSISASIDSMQQIMLRSEESALVLELLGQRSTEIGKIAEVIKEIAAQTNLLALNAAIEAARAGEQGRGFAVVADEVRQLAVKTAQATGKITEMIKGVQNEAQRSVTSMRAVTEGVTQGVALIKNAGDTLQQITTHSSSVANRMMDIAAATEEQSTTTQHLSQNIETVAKVAQKIANRAQQDALAADALATSVIGELDTIVQRYRLEQDEVHLEGAALEQMLHSVPPLVHWEDDLSVGISRVDEQHKILISLINRLHAAMKKRMSTTVTGEILKQLVDYTKTHFSMEEEMFKRYRYPEPEYSHHLQAHATFVKTLEEIHQKFLRGDESVGIKILNFLRQWLIEHIKGTDKKYVPFLLQQGIK